MTDAADATTDLRAFLDASPSPFHAARTTAERLVAAGFTEVELGGDWSQLPADGFVLDGGSVVAWRHGDVGPRRAVPDRRRAHRLARACASSRTPTTARPAGASSTSRSTAASSTTRGSTATSASPGGSRWPTAHRCSSTCAEGVARVPQLAVHLDRDVNDSGLKLDPQQHLRPVWGVGSPTRGGFAHWIAERAGLRRAGVLGPVPVRRAAGRPCSAPTDRCWRAAGSTTSSRAGRRSTALVDAASGRPAIAVVVLNDHEEVGSGSTTGAAGPLLERVLERHVLARGGDARRPAAGARRVGLRLGRQRPRRAPELPRAPRPRPPPDGQRRPGDQDQRNQRYATSSQTGGAVPRGVRDGRRAAPGVRRPQQHAVRLDDRPDHGDPARASPPSTSASPSSRCTRPASCAASTTRPRWPPPCARSSTGRERSPGHALDRSHRRSPRGRLVIARSNRRCSSACSFAECSLYDGPRQALALGGDGRHDRRADLDVHLARVDELGVPWASPARTRRCRPARSARRP